MKKPDTKEIRKFIRAGRLSSGSAYKCLSYLEECLDYIESLTRGVEVRPAEPSPHEVPSCLFSKGTYNRVSTYSDDAEFRIEYYRNAAACALAAVEWLENPPANEQGERSQREK